MVKNAEKSREKNGWSKSFKGKSDKQEEDAKKLALREGHQFHTLRKTWLIYTF